MKRILVLCIALAMIVGSFTGCGLNGGNSSQKSNKEASNEKISASSETVDSAEITNLVMVLMTFGTTPADFDAVVEKVNEISEKEIGVHVDIRPISIGDYTTQINLMLSSNEKLDLLPVMANNYSSYVAKGQLLAFNDELAQYGQGIIDILGEKYLQAGQVNGKQYGITTVRALAKNYGIAMRADLAEKYGVNYDSIDSFADFEDVLKAVKEGENGIVPLIPPVAKSNWYDVTGGYDNLGDSLGVLMNPSESLTVSNLYESDEYKEFLHLMRDWYQKGYILEDSSTASEVGPSLVKAGRGFAYICAGKPGFTTQEKVMTGCDMKYITIGGVQTNSAIVQAMQWAIPRNCTDTKKAMEFLNLLYTNADVENLLSWGIEGKHYVKTEDGNITYPEGVDASNTGYGLSMGWQMGNQYLTYVWEGENTNLWDQMKEFNNSATASKAMGFTFDAANIKTEVAACTNVTNQYRTSLECGMVDPDKILPEFIEALKDAGIDKIIAEKQNQLDTWSASQK